LDGLEPYTPDPHQDPKMHTKRHLDGLEPNYRNNKNSPRQPNKTPTKNKNHTPPKNAHGNRHPTPEHKRSRAQPPKPPSQKPPPLNLGTEASEKRGKNQRGRGLDR